MRPLTEMNYESIYYCYSCLFRTECARQTDRWESREGRKERRIEVEIMTGEVKLEHLTEI